MDLHQGCYLLVPPLMRKLPLPVFAPTILIEPLSTTSTPRFAAPKIINSPEFCRTAAEAAIVTSLPRIVPPLTNVPATAPIDTSMPKSQTTADHPLATRDDIKAILGNIDADKMLTIVELRPTIADVETASSWLAGDADVFGAGEPLKGAAADIVAILTEGEDEDDRAG